MGIGAYRVDDVRTAERAVLAQVPDGALMQRAAAALAVACARLLRRSGSGLVTGRRVVLLVGSGDNGGDALWAGARLLARGAQVSALLAGSRAHPAGLAAFRAAGGRVITVSAPAPALAQLVPPLPSSASAAPGSASAAPGSAEAVGAAGAAPGSTGAAGSAEAALGRADLVVDGLVGLSGRPGLRERDAALVAAIPAGVPVLAVDLPSGVDPDTGELPGAHVRADLTVTFGAAKPCLLLPPASSAAGDIELVDLGLRPHLPADPLVWRPSAADVARLWPVPEPGADKYRRGVLGIVAGSTGYPGAAVLAVSGAVRAGVGMIRYLGPPDATSAVRAARPEVVAGPGRVQAWLLGSGVDPAADDDQPAAIEAALTAPEPLPCVIDAGALAQLTQLPQAKNGRERFLLTPHAGELSALLSEFGESVERAEVERRPYRHAHRAAELTGAVVLLKGATTLVVRPDGRAASVAEAPSWLATAGAGDVLAGIAGALLSAGLAPFEAGALAAFVHGRAAAAASAGGPIAALDVAGQIGKTLAALLS